MDFEVRHANRPEPPSEVGAMVKVGLPGERFWCEVTAERPDGSIEAVVANDLCVVECIAFGDKVVLSRRNILESAGLADHRELMSLWAEHGSVPETLAVAALSWRAKRLQSATGVAPLPDTALVIPCDDAA